MTIIVRKDLISNDGNVQIIVGRSFFVVDKTQIGIKNCKR